MAKEYTWDVTIDGVSHRVTCTQTGNKYEIWVDDEDLTVLYRESLSTMSDGFEKSVTVCDKACLFVVWDEKPDLVVDGMMLSRGIDYREALSKRRKGFFIVYRTIFCLGVVLLCVMVFVLSMGWGDAVGWDDVVFYTISGALMMIYGCSKTRWLTHPKNTPIITEENSKGANTNEL